MPRPGEVREEGGGGVGRAVIAAVAAALHGDRFALLHLCGVGGEALTDDGAEGGVLVLLLLQTGGQVIQSPDEKRFDKGLFLMANQASKIGLFGTFKQTCKR